MESSMPIYLYRFINIEYTQNLGFRHTRFNFFELNIVPRIEIHTLGYKSCKLCCFIKFDTMIGVVLPLTLPEIHALVLMSLSQSRVPSMSDFEFELTMSLI